MELFHADPDFVKSFTKNPGKVAYRYKLNIDSHLLRPIWDKEFRNKIKNNYESHPLHKLQKEFRESFQDKEILSRLKTDSIENANYKAWRERQKERSKGLFHKVHNKVIVHIPFAFELSKGCSGGCPFCALAPPPLEDIFYYTNENAKLWRGVMSATKEILGYAAGASICYWATEPFDNPDYEKFCLDYFNVHGCFPHTTTANFLKNKKRTLNFLKTMKEHEQPYSCRFSITSLKMLRKTFEEFTSDELATVNLCLNNKESDAKYCNSGRARTMKLKINNKEKIYEEGSSACMSGFLVNMLDRTIKHITPCNPSEKWPLGYMVHEEDSFESATGYKNTIQNIIEKHMPLTLKPDDIVRFQPDLHFESFENGFEVSTKFIKRKFQNDAYMKTLGEMINSGNKKLKEINAMFDFFLFSSHYITDAIQEMYEKGVLDYAPQIEGSNI